MSGREYFVWKERTEEDECGWSNNGSFSAVSRHTAVYESAPRGTPSQSSSDVDRAHESPVQSWRRVGRALRGRWGPAGPAGRTWWRGPAQTWRCRRDLYMRSGGAAMCQTQVLPFSLWSSIT
jgi:hypothetical protein